MIVDMPMVNELDGQELSIMLPTTWTLTFQAEGFTSSPFGLRTFFALVPGMETLSFAGCPVNDHQLLELSHFTQAPIKTLKLAGCNCISAAVVASLVNTISSTLEVLECDVLDDWAVQTISRNCRQIRSIRWTLHSTTIRTESILAFCKNNGYLKSMAFIGEDKGPSPVTNELISSITAVCPHLQSVELVCTAADHNSLFALLDNCQRLQFISVKVSCVECTTIKIHGSSGGQRTCTLRWYGPNGFGYHLLSHFPRDLLVSAIGSGSKLYLLDRQGLHLLGQRHGPTLLTVGLMLGLDVLKADIQIFLTCCPNLSTLIVTCDSMNLLEDDDIGSISTFCPNLCSLGFMHCNKLTDDGIVHAIRYLKKLEKLGINYCDAISSALLPALTTLHPRVEAAVSNEL